MTPLLKARMRLLDYIHNLHRQRWDHETRNRRDNDAILEAQMAIMDHLLSMRTEQLKERAHAKYDWTSTDRIE